MTPAGSALGAAGTATFEGAAATGDGESPGATGAGEGAGATGGCEGAAATGDGEGAGATGDGAGGGAGAGISRLAAEAVVAVWIPGVVGAAVAPVCSAAVGGAALAAL